MSEARPTPWQKPAQAADRSKATGASQPSSVAIRGATAGVCMRWLTVATMTASTWLASMPAWASASRQAATLIICTDSSGPAKRRVRMPERCWIHSSLLSIALTSSALGTTRSGR